MDRRGEILNHLLAVSFLDHDPRLAFIAPQAERHFDSRSFMALLSVFTADPGLAVFVVRLEIGSVSPHNVYARVH